MRVNEFHVDLSNLRSDLSVTSRIGFQHESNADWVNMSIAVIGGGYVGLVLAAGLAEVGNSVVCAESDSEKRSLLISGISPIYEIGLTDLLSDCINQRTLRFVANTHDAIEEAQLIFIAVGTPLGPNGSADLSAVFQVADEIGSALDHDAVVAVKSTVPVGTCARLEQIICTSLRNRGADHTCVVISNPEFLKEGDALKDFRRPDRIVIGSQSEQAVELMRRVYAPFVRNHERMVIVDRESAELGKYASNAMLAARISFMNEMSQIAEATGADIEQVRRVVGSDARIGPDFLYAGPGFGGSCFSKDIQSLVAAGNQFGVSTSLLSSILDVNERQKTFLFDKLKRKFSSLKGKRIAVWGLSFKPNTDDVREAASLVLINELVRHGSHVYAYDPVVHSLGAEVDSNICICEDKYEALKEADALVLVTEWKIFRSPDFKKMREVMRGDEILDGRNIWSRTEVEGAGFNYQGIGK